VKQDQSTSHRVCHGQSGTYRTYKAIFHAFPSLAHSSSRAPTRRAATRRSAPKPGGVQRCTAGTRGRSLRCASKGLAAERLIGDGGGDGLGAPAQCHVAAHRTPQRESLRRLCIPPLSVCYPLVIAARNMPLRVCTSLSRACCSSVCTHRGRSASAAPLNFCLLRSTGNSNGLFHCAFSTARVRPPRATLLPLGHAPGHTLFAPRHREPSAAPAHEASRWPARSAAGRPPGGQGLPDRTGSW